MHVKDATSTWNWKNGLLWIVVLASFIGLVFLGLPGCAATGSVCISLWPSSDG